MATATMTAQVQPPNGPGGSDIFRITVEQYHQMIAAGVFKVDNAVELLDGYLVIKMSRDPAHDGTLWKLEKLLNKVIAERWILRVQSAVTLEKSEPEPDVVIATPPGDKYFDHHPGPDEVAVIVEVANTSLYEDRNVKRPIYASERIREYWIVNVQDRQIERYTKPRIPRSRRAEPGPVPDYAVTEIFKSHQSIPIILAGETLGSFVVRDILPPE